MAIKLLAFDLDGTIVKEDHTTITKKSLEAIRCAKNKGIVTVIATGRIVSALPDSINVDRDIDYIITANGARTQNAKTKEIMNKSGLNYKKVDELTRLADKLGIFYELYCDGKSYAPRKNKENIDSFNIHDRFYELLKNRPMPFEDISDLEDKGLTVEKFNMLSIPYDRYNEVWNAFTNIKDINQVSSIKINIEINSHTTSKWNAIQYLCKTLNIDTNDVMTIGDSGNDYEMIKNAGLGVCMGNGFDEVKDVAQYVTSSIEEDGFYKALKRYDIC